VGRILCSLVLIRLQTLFLFFFFLNLFFTLHRDNPQIATEPNNTVSLPVSLTPFLLLPLFPCGWRGFPAGWSVRVMLRAVREQMHGHLTGSEREK